MGIYELVAYFVSWDDILLHYVFDLDGAVLARSVMIILPSLPFLVLFHIISGYKQGKRQYYSISLASTLAIILSFAPGYFLIKYLGLDGAVISLIIFAVILAVLVLSMTWREEFEFKLESFFTKLFKKKKQEEKPIADVEIDNNTL
jgi:O-antigen/teichoic acid export membrane protein